MWRRWLGLSGWQKGGVILAGGLVLVLVLAVALSRVDWGSAAGDESDAACRKVVAAGREYAAGARTRVSFRAVAVAQQEYALDAAVHDERYKPTMLAIASLTGALTGPGPVGDVATPMAVLTRQCG